MGELNKIIVTEEQAKIIECEFNKDNFKCNKAFNLAASKETEGIGLVNIARIVEGEPYEVKQGGF